MCMINNNYKGNSLCDVKPSEPNSHLMFTMKCLLTLWALNNCLFLWNTLISL